eukprot:TRINITY_DN2101_c1_g1_i14.p1 TRINITY_DN2101_c1_g1~~TRINITY_DN2101_c1_g1_i14.p1  ORF type:complete len:104 (+),score=11.03 TRINITY_DN2101_c1_g1_i14:2094-2405(+)
MPFLFFFSMFGEILTVMWIVLLGKDSPILRFSDIFPKFSALFLSRIYIGLSFLLGLWSLSKAKKEEKELQVDLKPMAVFFAIYHYRLEAMLSRLSMWHQACLQ